MWTIFRYLRSPLDFLDETLGTHVFEVEKNIPRSNFRFEVVLPVSTYKTFFSFSIGYIGLYMTLNISKNMFSVRSNTSGLEFYFRFLKNTVWSWQKVIFPLFYIKRLREYVSDQKSYFRFRNLLPVFWKDVT